ncbi:MAG: DUF1801 domain-containing protein [Candidatus Dojkabacteria bacterium]
MRGTSKEYASIDEYISNYPEPVQKKLKEFRKVIHDLVPDAIEAMKYGMPTFRLNDANLVHFAAYDNHIGFYPTPSGVLFFEKKSKDYDTSKGAIKFLINDPIPWDLVKKVIEFRVEENTRKHLDRI